MHEAARHGGAHETAGGMMLEKIDDFEPEPDDHADAVFDEASEIAGLHVRLLIGITEYAYSHADDKDALDAIKMVFKWNPKHLIRAYERSPWAFKYENADSLSWEDVVATWTIGKTNDNLRAAEIEDQWRSHTLTLAELRDAVKAANGTRERKPTPIQQVGEIVRRAVGFARSGKSDSLEPGIEWLASELCSIKEIEEAVNHETA